MISIIFGFIVPLLIIIIYEYFNNKILDKRDIERVTKAPILGAIGHNVYNSDLPVYDNPKSSLAESFRTLRTNLQYIIPEKKSKIIGITSAISGEGKTFIAVNLATILSMSGKKILLAGIDLRKPKIHKIFNLANKKGVSTYLIGDSSFDEIIHETNIKNLYIAPSGPTPPNPAELIDSKRMDEFFETAEKEFEFVLFDTPPFIVVTDALLISKYTDSNIFIVRQNYSNKAILPIVNELYENKEVKNITILVNDVKVSGYYGYSYGYGYGYGYGYNYSFGQGYYIEDGEKGSKILNKIFKNS
jgi:capsular exopolysaccharide synthesis family protein